MTLTKANPYDVPPADGIPGLKRLLDPVLPQIQSALPSFMAKNAERMARSLLTCCSVTPALLDCTPKSLIGGLIQAAALGLELGAPAGQAYLLPFGERKTGNKSAALVIGYRGFIVLAERSGQVRRITPRVVYANDRFAVFYGSHQTLEHAPCLDDDRGAVRGFYAVIEKVNGGTDFEFMTLKQAEAHRDRFALSRSGPWATHFESMALKSCIRLLAKRMPLSVEWVAAATLDEQADEGVPQALEANLIVDAPPRDRLDELRERAQAARGSGEGEAD